MVESLYEVGAALRAYYRLARASEVSFDLFVELIPVGNEEYARAIDVGENPSGEVDHGERLATTLGMPDDAAFLSLHAILGGFDAEELVIAWHHLDATLEHDEVVEQVYESILLEHAVNLPVEVAGPLFDMLCDGNRYRIRCFGIILPLVVMFLRSTGCSMT